MRIIETTHLKTWAGSKPAESWFPYIVKSLILAVTPPEKLRMPSGDAVWVPGYDGVVVNKEENRFVPTGLSVWEVGTRARVKDKANEDYQKRSADEARDDEKGEATWIDRSQTTFVFVTPLVWTDKDDWVTKRRAEGTWKDIVVIDGVDLQDWLEAAPAVNLQFAAELGLVPEVGLQTPDQAWEEWSYLTNPPASEELVVTGRDEQEKELIGRLLSPSKTFIIRGDSPREAWGFTLAALRRVSPEEKRLSLYARTVVVDNEEVAGRLRHLENLIIVLKHTRGQVSGVLSSRGCHVVVPEGNDAHSVRNVIKLARPTHRPFAEALERMGLPEDEAERVSRSCGLSVTILQRQRAHANFERPRWSNDDATVVNLLPALLAGRWSNRSDSDREILRQLAGADDYTSVESQLQYFLGVDEPPLLKIDDMWALTAPTDAFQLVARRLTAVNLSRFKSAFREVFGRIDPKVEIPSDEWLYYDIKGERGHSGWLRSGMAVTLLLIAERGPDAQLLCVQSPLDYAEEVVRGLPGLKEDWRALASLRDQYARLMEAVPDPLLESLERLLEAKPDDVRRLFTEGGPFGGGGMHTGLLWGLETLAWSPEYLPRVALILSRLASLDPGRQLLNRPINSLGEIFLWWHPGTNAPLEQRLAAIDSILAREPDVGWALLARLLPGATRSVSHGTAKPRWRDFGDLPEDARTRHGQIQYLSAVVDRALDRLGSDPERWQAILNSLGSLNPSQRKKALKLLHAIAQGSTPADVKASLWKVLRDFTYQHRTFQSANWALKGELMDRLEAILSHLAPDDPIERNRWLFDEWLPNLPSGEQDIESRKQEVERLRQRAAKEVLQAQGVKGLVTLGTTCKHPGSVAFTILPLMVDLEAVLGFVNQAIYVGQKGVLLASQISGRARHLHGEAWRDLIYKEAGTASWPPEVTAYLLAGWPNERTTWEAAEELGEEVAAEYWRLKQGVVIDGSPEDHAYRIDRLIEAELAASAFSYVILQREEVPTKALIQLCDATFDELAQARTVEEVRQFGLSSRDVRQFLDELRERADLPRKDLARREYQALPLLGPQNARGLTIQEFMAEDPDFFVDILCDVFLPAHRDKTQDAEPSPDVEARAQAGFSLLQGMDRIPGQYEGTSIDEEALMKWINAVRKGARKADRAAIADQKIGGILAHAPEDPEDGGWPQRSVRNVIERLTADDVELGLIIERHNMRGVYTKDLYEGGDQERALASQYRDWAETSRARWPRMARVLEVIAQRWEEMARQEDMQAEQEKLG